MPLEDEPFSFVATKSQRVMIYARGKPAKTLKGQEARRFLDRVRMASPRQAQLLMARATGQFKFGNERRD